MDLSTNYMGLELRSPIVVASSPLSEKASNIKLMEDSGAGAIVLFSLFEEQLRKIDHNEKQSSASVSYLTTDYDKLLDKDAYLEHIQYAKSAVDIPIVASLNGKEVGGWTSLAKEMEQAGADAIELNIFFVPVDLSQNCLDVEQRYFDILKAVRENVSIPVAVKLNPFFSSVGNLASELAQSGASGLVLFNRFYEPDFDIENLEVINSLQLSSSCEIRLSLLWLGILHGQVNSSLAASSGVESATEIIKYLLAGADVVMTASALLRMGIPYLRTMQNGLEQWMVERQFDSLDEMRGIMSRARVNDPGAYERANYIKILKGFSGI
jgi:dihydroorotate dehydrogenase (fumarate)